MPSVLCCSCPLLFVFDGQPVTCVAGCQERHICPGLWPLLLASPDWHALQARANRGILYIDEVNLLDDGLVDVVLDSAASGRNAVEREGISINHPAKFIMIGSGNAQVRACTAGGVPHRCSCRALERGAAAATQLALPV